VSVWLTSHHAFVSLTVSGFSPGTWNLSSSLVVGSVLPRKLLKELEVTRVAQRRVRMERASFMMLADLRLLVCG
jgi:hypothetical protein